MTTVLRPALIVAGLLLATAAAHAQSKTVPTLKPSTQSFGLNDPYHPKSFPTFPGYGQGWPVYTPKPIFVPKPVFPTYPAWWGWSPYWFGW